VRPGTGCVKTTHVSGHWLMMLTVCPLIPRHRILKEREHIQIRQRGEVRDHTFTMTHYVTLGFRQVIASTSSKTAPILSFGRLPVTK